MADYYSHNDGRKKGDQYLDYDTGSSASWLWAVVVVVAIVALIALGSSGGEGVAPAEGAAPAAAPAAEGATAPATNN